MQDFFASEGFACCLAAGLFVIAWAVVAVICWFDL
jgi:hypothetical protein